MHITYEKGIVLEDGSKRLILDPKRKSQHSIVSHGHADHLIPGAHMTPETMAIMQVRKGSTDAYPVAYGKSTEIGGFEATLKPAGHVFGSAMVRVEDLLFTGDFNPEGGLTCDKAVAEACGTLVIESTYGRPDLSLPPKDAVSLDILTWLEHETSERPVAIGAYSFGKAQELVALVGAVGVPVFVTPEIARICEVYRAHGVSMEYTDISEANGLDYPYILITSPRSLRERKGTPVDAVKRAGGATAYVSGWVARYSYISRYGLDAQFPFSDHADFDDLLWFTEQCRPKRVYTVHGYTKSLAKQIEKRLGIPAEPLE